MKIILWLLVAIAAGGFGYNYGKIQGKAEVTCPPPKIVRVTYSTEELHRMIRARKRMEAVK